MNFLPFPELTTERLHLRRIIESDIDSMFAIRSNPEVMKYVPRALAKSNDDALVHIRTIEERIQSGTGINWAITIKGTTEMIGVIGHYRLEPENFRAEIGYMMLPQFHGKGYITEAVATVVRFGFDVMKLHSIEAVVHPNNVASARVLEKNKFLKEGHLRENVFFEGRFVDSVYYSLLKKDLRS